MVPDTQHIEAVYRQRRARNNEASRKSRAAAKAARARPEWLALTPPHGPGLSPDELRTALAFLGDLPCPDMTPATIDALRKHLEAKRAVNNDHIGHLLARLPAITA